MKFSNTQLSKMIQSGELMYGIIVPIPNPTKTIKADELSKKVTLSDIIKIADISKIIMNAFKNASKKTFGAGITIANNEIKDTRKVIKSLWNRGISLKGTTRKITNQKEGFLDFLGPSMRAGLPLMKYVLTPIAKNVLLPFGLSAGMSAVDAAIQK